MKLNKEVVTEVNKEEEVNLPVEIETEEKPGIFKRAGSFCKRHWKAGALAVGTFVVGGLLGYSKGRLAERSDDLDDDEFDDVDDYEEEDESEEE